MALAVGLALYATPTVPFTNGFGVTVIAGQLTAFNGLVTVTVTELSPTIVTGADGVITAVPYA